jgi:hypothetical protein
VSRRSRQSSLLLVLVLLSCSPTRGCVESDFELAPESRLPVWLHLPPGTPREDVAVFLYDYVPPFSTIDDTVFIVTIKGRRFREITTRRWYHPRTNRQLALFYATQPRPKYPYPSYVVVEVGNEVDVIEHREYREQNREPTRALFWMCDDPQVLHEAKDSVADRTSLRTF